MKLLNCIVNCCIFSLRDVTGEQEMELKRKIASQERELIALEETKSKWY
jgi:hypothetical protein